MNKYNFNVYLYSFKIGTITATDRTANAALKRFAKSNNIKAPQALTAKREYINSGGNITTVTIAC